MDGIAADRFAVNGCTIFILKARFQSDKSYNVYSRKCLLHRPCHPSECVDIRQICQIRVRLKSLSESPRHPFVPIREPLFLLIRDSLFLPIRVSLFVPIRVSLFVLIRDSLFPPISESLFVPIRVKRNFRFFVLFVLLGISPPLGYIVTLSQFPSGLTSSTLGASAHWKVCQSSGRAGSKSFHSGRRY